MVKVSAAEVKAAIQWLKRHAPQAKACTLESSRDYLAFLAGDPTLGIWCSRRVKTNGPEDFKGYWSVSIKHLLKAVTVCTGPFLSLGMNGDHLIVGNGVEDIAELPAVVAGHLGGGSANQTCERFVTLPATALSKVLKKSAFDDLWTYLQPDSEMLLVVGTVKSVQLIASNFTNRTIQAEVAGPDSNRKPFKVALRREAIHWLSRAQNGDVIIGESDSLSSLAFIEDGIEKGSILIQKKEQGPPSFLSLRVPKSQWGPGCLVNARELKRAFIQLMAPSGGALPEAIELAIEPGQLSLAATFAMGSVKARVKVPCEAPFSAKARFEYPALAPAFKSVWTSSLVIHVASNNRLVLRSKGLVQTIHGLA